MREQWSDLSHGKFSDPLCHYVAEAHDGSIIGDAQDYVSSEHDVDYWAKLGKRRIYHVDSQGFHYLWRHATEEERDRCFDSDTRHLLPISAWAAAELHDDGDTVAIGDDRTIRLRFEADDTDAFDQFDCYGKVYPERYAERRPAGFDGNAEKLWPPQNGDCVWWQPPADVKPTDPGFDQLRTMVLDLLAFGMQGVIVELLSGVDAYQRPIVVRAAALWGLEPFIDKDYLTTVVAELIDEVTEEET